MEVFLEIQHRKNQTLAEIWKYFQKCGKNQTYRQRELKGLTEEEYEVELRGHEQVKIKNKLKQ